MSGWPHEPWGEWDSATPLTCPQCDGHDVSVWLSAAYAMIDGRLTRVSDLHFRDDSDAMCRNEECEQDGVVSEFTGPEQVFCGGCDSYHDAPLCEEVTP